MNLNAKIVRAIACEFVGRKLNGIALVLGSITLLALVGAVWLTTLSAWWWLLVALVSALGAAGIIVYLLAKIIVKSLRPKLNIPQTEGVTNFVNKLERVAESLQTPVFIIVFRVAFDIVLRRDHSLIQTVVADSTTLRKDYLELQRDFK